MKKELICPYCGFISKHFYCYFVDGDLISCSKCNGLIDVVGTEDCIHFEKHIENDETDVV